jgi:hypothetical protein
MADRVSAHPAIMLCRVNGEILFYEEKDVHSVHLGQLPTLGADVYWIPSSSSGKKNEWTKQIHDKKYIKWDENRINSANLQIKLEEVPTACWLWGEMIRLGLVWPGWMLQYRHPAMLLVQLDIQPSARKQITYKMNDRRILRTSVKKVATVPG